MPAVTFSDLVAAFAPTEKGFSIAVGEDWRQGRTLYGGISAALCLAAAERTFSDLPPLRSAQVSFVGPAAGEVELRAELLRRGKSAAFVGADLLSDGQIGTRAVFCFGAARESAYARAAAPAPKDLPRPDTCESFFAPGIGPAFRQHFDMRLARGLRPLSGAADPDIWLWVRHLDPADPVGAAALRALADAPPPAAMSAFATPAIISSMTWMVDILDGSALTRAGWKLFAPTPRRSAKVIRRKRCSFGTRKAGPSSRGARAWLHSGSPLWAMTRSQIADAFV
jgi:hypothetical protein